MANGQSLIASPAGHPFRRTLPPTARDGRRSSIKAARNDDQDLKLFVLSFTAFFICIYSFIY